MHRNDCQSYELEKGGNGTGNKARQRALRAAGQEAGNHSCSQQSAIKARRGHFDWGRRGLSMGRSIWPELQKTDCLSTLVKTIISNGKDLVPLAPNPWKLFLLQAYSRNQQYPHLQTYLDHTHRPRHYLPSSPKCLSLVPIITQ